MNNDNHLLTLKIDTYIKGQLSDIEQKAFEQDLQTDAILVEHVRLQRAELILLERIAEESLRLKVRKWSAAIDDEGKPFKKWWQHPLSIFAFLVGIVALFFLFFPKTATPDTVEQSTLKEKQDTTQSTPTSKVLPKIDTIKKIELPIPNTKPATQSPKPKTQNAPPIAVVKNRVIEDELLAYIEDIERTSERGDDMVSPLSKSVQFIQNQNFTSARSLLTNINPQAINYADEQFLLATIDYLQKKPRAAAVTFKTLSDMDGYIRKEQATYYWATSLMANGQLIAAKGILTKIAADTEHPKHDAAIVLLKSL